MPKEAENKFHAQDQVLEVVRASPTEHLENYSEAHFLGR